MCGFITIFQSDSPLDAAGARLALDALTHRGPDALGEWQEDGIYLGHRRLAIIDLKTGEQPMISADGRHVIVFNGEIYNFPELRNQLEGAGVRFRTSSDTEVILEGFRRWGPPLIERIHGMFAFVIWDRLRKSAFGARDRLGIKPLCWTMHRGALIISSTMEPLFELGACGSVDLFAVRDLMTFDYIPAPRSIFENVHKFEPGTRFEWCLGDSKPDIRSYWMPPLADKTLPPPDDQELERLLDSAVKRQMISDVPIGAFLSGGIDSSLLVALMARHSPAPVRTFSVAFNDREYDESPVADLVARQYGTRHTLLRAEDISPDELLRLLGMLDEPFCDSTLVPTYTLSSLTGRQVKVALSGDGGDEVFGGYTKYLMNHASESPLMFGSALQHCLKVLPWRPRGASRLYWRFLGPVERLRFQQSCYGDFPVFRKDMRQLLDKPYRDAAEVQDFFEPWEQVSRRFGQRIDADTFMRTDLGTYLTANCLLKTDRASMMASLEVRVPYLDEMVLDRIVPLHSDRKIVYGQLKALLQPIARRLLPKEAWNRPKHGFNVPLDRWLAGIWRPAVETALDWGESHFRLFNYRYLRRLHRINLTEGGVSGELWNPFVLIAWAMARRVSIL